MIQGKIRSILEKYAVSFRTNSKSFILDCPRCSKRNKLYIRKEDGRFVCWVCQEKEAFYGKAEWALTELTGESISELRYFLYEGRTEQSPVYLDVQIHDFFDSNSDEIVLSAEASFEEIEPNPDFIPISSPKARVGADYLAGRGIPLQVQEEYKIMYWPAKRSVVFPAHVRGKLVGWQTRIAGSTTITDPFTGLTGDLPKAQTSVGLKKDRLLMFQDRITDDHVVLAEGPVDAIKAHRCGGNVASLGKHVSGYQLDIIRNSGVRKLYLALDPDAFNESQAILKKMVNDVEIYAMTPDAGDLGQMSFGDVRELFVKAPRLGPNHLFLWLNRELYNGI